VLLRNMHLLIYSRHYPYYRQFSQDCPTTTTNVYEENSFEQTGLGKNVRK